MRFIDETKWPSSNLRTTMRHHRRRVELDAAAKTIEEKRIRKLKTKCPWLYPSQILAAIRLADCKTKAEFLERTKGFDAQKRYAISKAFEDMWEKSQW